MQTTEGRRSPQVRGLSALRRDQGGRDARRAGRASYTVAGGSLALNVAYWRPSVCFAHSATTCTDSYPQSGGLATEEAEPPRPLASPLTRPRRWLRPRIAPPCSGVGSSADSPAPEGPAHLRKSWLRRRRARPRDPCWRRVSLSAPRPGLGRAVSSRAPGRRSGVAGWAPPGANWVPDAFLAVRWLLS